MGALAVKEQSNLEKESSKESSEVSSLRRRLYDLLKKEESLRNANSFGYVVLYATVQGSYKRAANELEMVHVGLEEYSEFEHRARRFIEHAKSLVAAIKVKYEVCVSDQVSKGKQKELADMIVEHFIELRKSIIAIERIQKTVRAGDMRSTLWFLRTIFWGIVAMFGAYMYFFTLPQLTDLSNSYLFSWMLWKIP